MKRFILKQYPGETTMIISNGRTTRRVIRPDLDGLSVSIYNILAAEKWHSSSATLILPKGGLSLKTDNSLYQQRMKLHLS